MSPSSSTAYSSELLARAAKIRLACFDVDGTLTDGRLLFDERGGELKAFHVHDGQGLVLLRNAGIVVALVTARRSAIAERRGAELGIETHVGVEDKLACVDRMRARLGIDADETAFMGDDVPDCAPMRAAGLAVAPANAQAVAIDAAHWTTPSRGGEGAARELCELLLAARGARARDAGGARDAATVSA